MLLHGQTPSDSAKEVAGKRLFRATVPYIVLMSLHGRRVGTNIPISIYDFTIGCSPHFRNLDNLSDGEDNCVFDSRIRTTMSCMLYSQATG